MNQQLYTYEKFIEESNELIKKTNGIFNLCTYSLLDISYLKGYIKSIGQSSSTDIIPNTNDNTDNTEIIIIDDKDIKTKDNSLSYSLELNIVFSETYQLPVLYFIIYNDITGEITPFTSFIQSFPTQTDLVKFFEISQQNHPFTGRVTEFLHLCKFNQFLNKLQSLNDSSQSIHTILLFWLSIILQLFSIDIQTLIH